MRVEFNKLPRVVRERFVDRRNALLYAPPVIAESMGCGPILLVVLGFAATGVLAIHLVSEVNPDRELFLLMAPAVFTLVVGLLLALRPKPRPAPYASGTYLFASCVVTTHGGELEILPSSEVASGATVQYVGSRTGRRMGRSYQLTHKTGTFTFPLTGSEADGKALVERYATSLAAYRVATRQGDAATMAALDPFFECSSTGAWVSGEPPAPPIVSPPPKTRTGLRVIAAVLAGLVAVPLIAGARYGWRKLDDARRERQNAEALANRPPPSPLGSRQYQLDAFRRHAASPEATAAMEAILMHLNAHESSALWVWVRGPVETPPAFLVGPPPRGRRGSAPAPDDPRTYWRSLFHQPGVQIMLGGHLSSALGAPQYGSGAFRVNFSRSETLSTPADAPAFEARTTITPAGQYVLSSGQAVPGLAFAFEGELHLPGAPPTLPFRAAAPPPPPADLVRLSSSALATRRTLHAALVESAMDVLRIEIEKKLLLPR